MWTDLYNFVHTQFCLLFLLLCLSPSCLPPSPQALQFVMDIVFQYNPPPFLLAFSCCIPVSYLLYHQILFNLISPSFLWSSSLLCCFHSASHYLFWHSVLIHPLIMPLPCLSEQFCDCYNVCPI